jgi:hypothetical protein
MIVEKQMECRLAGENEVLGGNLPQRHFCPSQNPIRPTLQSVISEKTLVFSLKMDGTLSSKTLVNIYQTINHYVLDDSNHHH